MRWLWVVLFIGCVRDVRPVDVPECTGQTPLVPGIPGSPGHYVVTDVHPDGASELALLMRGFVDDLKAARADVVAGRAVTPRWSVHRRMRCAWPTSLAERDARYDALAVAYLEQRRALDAHADTETYNRVLSGCLACHESMCPGPIELIEGLRLP
jgi:hypothetical protein